MKQQTWSNQSLKRKHSFYLSAPVARSVKLAGDFTNWAEQPVNLQKGADGIWRINLDLAPGEHHYRFIVDGEWCDDPACALHAPNPYGTQDAVRQVA